MPITARQRRVLDYIRRYFEVHGEPPTIAEIGKEFGMKTIDISNETSAKKPVRLKARRGQYRFGVLERERMRQKESFKLIQFFHLPKRNLIVTGQIEIKPPLLTSMIQPAIGYLDPG